MTAAATVPVIESTVESSGSGTQTTVTTTATRPDNDVYVVVGTKDDNNAWESIPGDWDTAIYDLAMGNAARHTVWAFKGVGVPASYTIGHDDEVTEFTFMHLTGADGDGILSTITFRGKSAGSSNLNFIDSEPLDIFMGKYSEGSDLGWVEQSVATSNGTIAVKE